MQRHDLTQHLATLCARAGQGHGDGEPLVPPIVQSTTFCRDGLESQAEHCYSRESNPTVAALEQALGALEDAPPAVAYGTGLAAETGLFLSLLQAGDHVVCSSALYGGTTRLLQQLFPNLGVTTTFVDSTDLEALERALRPSTRLVFLESPANPTLDVTDIRRASALAHEHGALCAVDNTFLTPLLQQPLELGADVSVYSTTKFIEGHSVALGGSLVTRDEALLDRLRFVRKCTGSILAPFNAWLTLQGLRTLPVRLERQSRSARAIANALIEEPDVARVHYPTLCAEQAALADRQHVGPREARGGAVVSFELAGGYERACAVLDEVRECRLVEHVGSVETLLTHSASMTHGGVSREEREAAGVTEGLLRLSVGLEDPDVLIADLRQAIATTASSVKSEGGVPCIAR